MGKKSLLLVNTSKQALAMKYAISVVGVLLFSCATSAGALVRIPLPFTPVPITLQTYFVLLSGLALGTIGGAVSQMLYLLYGILGFPVFAGEHTGMGLLFLPTGGYLVGFIAAAYISGFACKPRTSFVMQIACLFSATFLIYVLGSIVLALNLNCSLIEAVKLGVLPFIPGDICKIAAAYGSWNWGRKLLGS
ncbi:MAG: biotin transporter BioY [Candidatus Sumerlaeia bacterium]|nr:biotin transporter BioY [Candidatus Sumerlaeia bacterium]